MTVSGVERLPVHFREPWFLAPGEMRSKGAQWDTGKAVWHGPLTFASAGKADRGLPWIMEAVW